MDVGCSSNTMEKRVTGSVAVHSTIHRIHTEYTQNTHIKHTEYTQKTHRKHTEYTHKIHRKGSQSRSALYHTQKSHRNICCTASVHFECLKLGTFAKKNFWC